VSADVAKAMARGALEHARADISGAVTGIAGPTGSGAGKPIGLVFIATARTDGAFRCIEHRFGDIGREAVRERSAAKVLSMMMEEISDAAAAK
jgi:nicotinamide-nucleotide amidase